MDCSLPGSCVHRIFQARGLGWIAISLFHRLDPVNLRTVPGGLRKHCTAIQRRRLLSKPRCPLRPYASKLPSGHLFPPNCWEKAQTTPNSRSFSAPESARGTGPWAQPSWEPHPHPSRSLPPTVKGPAPLRCGPPPHRTPGSGALLVSELSFAREQGEGTWTPVDPGPASTHACVCLSAL